jgi:hypothetical protein
MHTLGKFGVNRLHPLLYLTVFSGAGKAETKQRQKKKNGPAAPSASLFVRTGSHRRILAGVEIHCREVGPDKLPIGGNALKLEEEQTDYER